VRITLLCIGRLGRAPEGALSLDYAARATAQGRSLGIGPVEIVELEARKSGKEAEAALLLERLPAGAHIIACDEHGQAPASRAFASRLQTLRDAGERQLVFVIGGADGLSKAVLERAQAAMAFGPQTWPHALARVMLAEQVYRAVSLLAGSPYHRD